MKRTRCDRSWQVEAARDGRLDPDMGRVFAQHARSCASCQAEREALDDLAHGLQQIGQVVDQVALRRLRQQTMEQANQLLVGSSGPAFAGAHRLRTSHAWGWATAACLACAAAFVALRAEPPTAVTRASAVRVEPLADAHWQRTRTPDVEHVALSAGTLLFHVTRAPNDARLRVHLPDGEIEDLGTTFRVSVQGGKTREITVSEGRVLFHKKGGETLHLVAGSTWTPPPDSTLVQTASTAAEPVAPEPAAPQREPEKPGPRRARAPSAATTPADSAEQALSAREDVAYLHVLALLREGRRAEARLAALAYLSTFPAGFRRTEVLRVAGSLSPMAEADGGP